MYRQCVLTRKTSSGGKMKETTWVPLKYAKKGNYLSLKRDKKWENGWLVESTGKPVSSEKVEAMQYEYTKHRITTLPMIQPTSLQFSLK